VHIKLQDTEVALQTELGQLRALLAQKEAEHAHAGGELAQKGALLSERDNE
jgi:hypothetical protein